MNNIYGFLVLLGAAAIVVSIIALLLEDRGY